MPCHIFSPSFSPFQFSEYIHLLTSQRKKKKKVFRDLVRCFILACFDCWETEREEESRCILGALLFSFFFSLKVSELSMYLQLFLRNAELLAGKTLVKKICTDQFVVPKHIDLSKSILCF